MSKIAGRLTWPAAASKSTTGSENRRIDPKLKLVQRLERGLYSARSGWEDGTAFFHRLCSQVLRRGDKVLEIGAGPSNPTSRFLASFTEVHGIDPDADVLRNEALASATVLEGDAYPFPDNSFDHCVSDYVVEHVADGPVHLGEVARVLRPGGAYIFRTVNRHHYVALIAAHTPQWFHVLVANRARANPRDTHDPYPTRYAMNSAGAVRAAAARAGLTVDRIEYVEKEPAYGRFFAPLFLALAGYERLVNSTEKLRGLRANLFVVLRKPI